MKVTEKEEKLAASIKPKKAEKVERNQSKELAVQGKRRTLTWQDKYGKSHTGVVKREYPDQGVFVLVGGQKVRVRKAADWKGESKIENVAKSYSVS